MDRRFIRRYWLCCFAFFSSSGATRKHTVGSSHGLCKLSFLHAVYQLLRHLHHASYCVQSVHPTVPFFFFFFHGFNPWKINYLLILACGIFACMGPRNVYKDKLKKLVSPIDHAVLNHQNQTRTNGIWGHVHYTIYLSVFPFCNNYWDKPIIPSNSLKMEGEVWLSQYQCCE
jgi:hypothetical protein